MSYRRGSESVRPQAGGRDGGRVLKHALSDLPQDARVQATWSIAMEDLKGYARLAKVLVLADEIVEQSSKATIAEAARILAAELAHYQRQFGKVTIDKADLLIDFRNLTESQAEWVSDALENLAVALITVRESEKRASAWLQ